MLQHEPKAPAFTDRLDSRIGSLTIRAAFTNVYPLRQSHTDHEEDGGDQHHRIGTDRLKKPASHLSACDCSERAADSDNCKQPFALRLRIDVVTESPELRHDEEIK